jgi:hypothetical protein
MKQNDISVSMRFAPVVLAGALLVLTLGFLSLRVNAQENGEDVIEVEKQTKANTSERRILADDQKIERQEIAGRSLAEGEMQQERLGQNDEKSFSEGAIGLQRQEMSSDLRGQATALRERLQAHKEEKNQKEQAYKAKLNTQTQVRLGQYVGRITVRMSTATERLMQIANRVLARIEILEERGVDLTDARNQLEVAYVTIEDAEKFVSLFEDISKEAIASEDPATRAQEVRDAAKLVKDSLQTVHTALSETVQLVKVGMPVLEDISETEESEEEVSDEEATTEETVE